MRLESVIQAKRFSLIRKKKVGIFRGSVYGKGQGDMCPLIEVGKTDPNQRNRKEREREKLRGGGESPVTMAKRPSHALN